MDPASAAGRRAYGGTAAGSDEEDNSQLKNYQAGAGAELGMPLAPPGPSAGWSAGAKALVAASAVLLLVAATTSAVGSGRGQELADWSAKSVLRFVADGALDGGTGDHKDSKGDTDSVIFTGTSDKDEDEEEDEEEEDEDADATTSSVSFSLKRENYELYPYFGESPSEYTKYSFLQNFCAIIEPSQNMQLSVWGIDEDNTNTFSFKVCSNADTSADCYTGSHTVDEDEEEETTVNIACAPFETFTVTVEELDDDDNVVSSSEGTAVCMYVRREIRSLTSEDLSKTMDAMYTLWSVDDDEGQALYGDSYHSSAYFASAHDFNAAQQDADHIHEGLGFLPQHIKLTNMFEEAVQAVDPSVALPYWDFTIDVAANLTIFESPMFTEDTFGSINPPTDRFWGFTWANDSLDDTHIKNGRWRKTKAEINTRFADLSNGFGYMRGPWNTNPSKYIVRFSAYSPSLPSCSDYYGGLGLPAFMTFLQDAPYGSHASTHGVIGAVFGCDLLDSYRASGLIVDEDSQLQICKKWGFYMKELYRADYIAPREDCSYESLTREGIDCGFVCQSDKYDDMLTGLSETMSSQYVKSGMTDDDWSEFRTFICEGDGSLIFVGDHLESASPADPSFWPIHPTQERLLQLKYMVGSVSGSAWPSDSKNDYVCDKAQCYESSYGSKDYYGMCCYGHYENDQLLDFINGDKNSGTGLTNSQVLAYTDPTSDAYAMTYIYDHFRWDHCEEDFAAEIESLYSTDSKESSTHNPTPASPTKSPTTAPSFAPTEAEEVEEVEVADVDTDADVVDEEATIDAHDVHDSDKKEDGGGGEEDGGGGEERSSSSRKSSSSKKSSRRGGGK